MALLNCREYCLGVGRAYRAPCCFGEYVNSRKIFYKNEGNMTEFVLNNQWVKNGILAFLCGKDCRGAVGCHWTERVYE